MSNKKVCVSISFDSRELFGMSKKQKDELIKLKIIKELYNYITEHADKLPVYFEKEIESLPNYVHAEKYIMRMNLVSDNELDQLRKMGY